MAKWEANIRKVVPYVPGEQPLRKVIKLNTNENPYGPSARVKEAIVDSERFKLYPDPTAGALVKAIADYHNVDEKQVFVGVGSDDVIAMSFLTFFNSDKPIFFPDITYSFYDVWADLFRIKYETKALKDDFSINIADYKNANGGIIIPNPNAPTSLAMGLESVEEIVKSNPDVIVIIDEAYVDFGGQTALPLVDKYDNLLVVRTFSKSRSMAGMRIGYAIGNEQLIKYLSDVKYSFNSYTMNMPSIIYGVESIKDEEYFQANIKKVIDTREWFVSEINKLGYTCPKSSANFIFMTHPEYSANKIFEAAKEADIFVRYFNKPRINNYLRVTIGTKEEMEKFLDFLKGYTE